MKVTIVIVAIVSLFSTVQALPVASESPDGTYNVCPNWAWQHNAPSCTNNGTVTTIIGTVTTTAAAQAMPRQAKCPDWPWPCISPALKLLPDPAL
ncbi:hypothetical protein TruAng_010649 [Truncatella angustata]|nr:hypothetical protein TruAng_010649 [Truncatella angustata]